MQGIVRDQPHSLTNIMPATVPRAFSTANNGSDKPNGFETALAQEDAAALKLHHKKQIAKQQRKRMIAQWRRGNCDRTAMANRLSKITGALPIEILSDLDFKTKTDESKEDIKRINQTKKEIKRMADKMVLDRFGPEPEE